MATVHTTAGIVEIAGSPSDAEVAAIVAAIEMSWPKPVAAAPSGRRTESITWRHSGRWWSEGRLPNRWK